MKFEGEESVGKEEPSREKREGIYQCRKKGGEGQRIYILTVKIPASRQTLRSQSLIRKF